MCNPLITLESIHCTQLYFWKFLCLSCLAEREGYFGGATKKMADISLLPDDVILFIFRLLNTEDRIAFAFTCEQFRQICMDGSVFRKVDLSRNLIGKTQRGAISNFFRDKQMVQKITDLNISNCRVFNWQLDDLLEEFIISICPHLGALHVLNCGMRLQTLHRILKQAPKLTSLSWSLWDFTSEDVEFLLNCIESSDEICLKNIKHLHIETLQEKSRLQVLKYFVMSSCEDIEELKIYILQMEEYYCNALSFLLPVHQRNASTSIEDKLQNLHSLTVVALQDRFPFLHRNFEDLQDFISSVVRKKSREINWRKFWISPEFGISSLQYLLPTTDPSVLFHGIQPKELQSIEEITAHAGWTQITVDELQTLFQRIDDNTVRSLHLHRIVPETTSILEPSEPILRVGGHVLKFLSLSFDALLKLPGEITFILHTLFYNCTNVVELDLLGCYFEKDICEPLSQLRHLTKVQLQECAISSKHCKNTHVEISNANLLSFVENCKNITDFDVRSCHYLNMQSLCRLTDDDLLPLAKLSNLESLTLHDIRGVRELTFLKSISENCKYLTILRIRDQLHGFTNTHIPNLRECAKLLKHLALDVSRLDLQSEDFWSLLSHAKNLERLCIRYSISGLINIPFAVKTLKSLPHLHVLHLHTNTGKNVEVFHNQIKRMLVEEKFVHSSFFELVTEYFYFGRKRQVFKTALPLNFVELCNMTPILEIPRF